MSCGKVYDKLWNNYLAKYGDFRERLQIIRNDHQCFILPRLRQPSLNVHDQSLTSMNTSVVNGKFYKKCNPILPSECCHSSMINKNLSLTLTQTNLDQLEKLIQAEDFPNNIFPVDTRSRSSIDNETELPITKTILDDIHRLSSKRLTSSLNSIFSKNNVRHSITKHDEGSSMYPRSKKSIHKSELVSSSHDPTASPITNPYTQLVERLRRAEKTKFANSDTKKSVDSTIDANTHTRIQNLLSFFDSLDNYTDNKQNSNTLDENTLISLFSVDNHLSSPIYVPTNIHQLNIVPKDILHSLKNTSDDEKILNKILDEEKLKKSIYSRPLINITKQQSYLNDDSQSSNLVDQDNELNSRLSSTYTVKAFKEFLIHRNKSTRLPKLFHDIDRWHQH